MSQNAKQRFSEALSKERGFYPMLAAVKIRSFLTNRGEDMIPVKQLHVEESNIQLST